MRQRSVALQGALDHVRFEFHMIQFSFSVESDWYIQIGSRFSAGFPPPFLQDIWDFNASKGNCTCDGCSIQVP